MHRAWAAPLVPATKHRLELQQLQYVPHRDLFADQLKV
jgi:hypothetical protein